MDKKFIDENGENMSIEDENENMDIEDEIVKTASVRNMIKSHESADTLDWLVLNFKLGGTWENFKVFGFDMDNRNLIWRAIALGTGFIMLLNLNTELGF